MVDIGHLLRRLTTDDLDRPAISLETEETWTYAELRDTVYRYANALTSLGVGPGDRVGILLYNSLEYWGLYLATTTLGAIAVRLNWRLSSEEMAYAAGDSGCRVLCLHDDFAEAVGTCRADMPVSAHVVFPHSGGGAPGWAVTADEVLTRGSNAEPDRRDVNPDDPAMIMYTSGTTGRPKGAVLTHRALLGFAGMQIMRWKYDSSTVTMTTGTLYHVASLEDFALPTVLAGGHTVVARSRGFSVERLLSVLEFHRVQEVFIFPVMIYEMLRLPELESYDLSSLRSIYTGGSATMPWAVRGLVEKFPAVELRPLYGLTESPIVTVSTREDVERYPDGAGRPMPFVEIRFERDDGTLAAPNEEGEVCVKSPANALEYWQRPDANAATFIDGWCRTGDLGHLTEDGILRITGRKKDMIKSGGENIYPIEVESALTDHPDIIDAAVIGVSDARFQEAVCAVVVQRPGAEISERDVVVYCQSRLAGYKKPRHVVFVEDLPRNPAGKVLKYVLKERYAHLGTPEGVV